MSRVAVIVPAYNPGHYLDKAIQSIIAQTFSDWECIVVDDGSKEDLSRIDSIHPQVRRIRQDNRGLSTTRNTGILQSQSEYVAFLDADDLWHPTKLQLQIELLDAYPNIAFCHTAHETIDEIGLVTGPGFSQDLKDYAHLLRGACVCVSTVVVRRSCFNVSGLFDPLLSGTQDYDMWLKLARYFDVGFVPTSQAGYRVHSSNMSGNVQGMVDELIFILQRHKKIAHARKDRQAEAAIMSNIKATKIAWGGKSYDKCRAHFKKGDYKTAIKEFVLSLKLSPSYTMESSLKYVLARSKKARTTDAN